MTYSSVFKALRDADGSRERILESFRARASAPDRSAGASEVSDRALS